jgi:hypothetical protein
LNLELIKTNQVNSGNQTNLMAEFKFSCPKCSQNILCDLSYAGAGINCPSCQQSIKVPPPPSVVPPGEKVFQVRVSTARNIALIILFLLLLAGAIEGVLYLFAGTRSVTFKAWVDGSDALKLQGKQLWLEHLTWSQPTKIEINGKKWETAWNNNKTEPFSLGSTFPAKDSVHVKIKKISGRGKISIVERPSSDNDYTLTIKIDDGPQPGADWYEFTVSW